MQGKKGNSSDSIKDILDKITMKTSDTSGSVSKNTSSDKSSGLVFDDANKNSSAAKNAPTRVNFEEPKKVPNEKPVELSVPDKYRLGTKYNSGAENKETPRIMTTYVPKFTGASLNYRMMDDPRIKAAKTVAQTAKTSSVDTPPPHRENIDPTAEYEETQKAHSVSVNNTKPTNDDLGSASKVFKFAQNEPVKEVPAAPIPEIKTQPKEEPMKPVVEINTAPPVEEKVAPAREYKIPDPTDMAVETVEQRTVSSAIAAKSVLEEAPSAMADKNGAVTKAREYTSFGQRDAFKDRFIDTIMSVYVRFFAALILTVILAVAEAMFASGVDIPKILHLNGIPGAMALLDLQFVLCLFLLALPETILSFRCLVRRKVVPEIFLTVAFAVLITYTVVISVHSPRSYGLYGLLFAIFVLVAISSSYFKTAADFTAFKRASKNGEKTIIDNSYTRTLERENAALDGAVKTHKSRTARTFRTLFVSDFFGRTTICAENSFSVLIILGITFGLSLVVGLIALFIPGGWVNAVTAFTLVFMLSCPAMSIMVHKIPYFHASREAEIEKSAVIGEKSLYLYSGVDVVTFDDTEVFGAEDVTLQRIMLYGRSDNLTKALRQMSALFMNVGGPLDVLFSNSLDRKCAPAQSVVVEANGISGKIDGRNVSAGTMEYMLSKGAKIPAEENGQAETLHASTKVMYAAENGVVYAKFYVRYSFSEEFSMLLPTLEDAGIKPLVYTRDPNVTNSLIAALTAGADKIRVMRKYDTVESGEIIYRKTSAGIMTNGDKTNVVNMILLAKKYEDLQSYFGLTELISMLVGAVLAAVLSIGGMSILPSLALGIFQIAWCGVLHFISAVSFRNAKAKNR